MPVASMPVAPETLAAFALASAVLLVIPGPTILMVVGQSLAHGRPAALASVAGVALGDLLVASLSVAGLGALLAASSGAFALARIAGAGWLIWLGVSMWREAGRPPAVLGQPAGRSRIFRDALLVTALNPKGIVFFVAFVPQFVDPGRPFAPQAATFVAVFVLLGTLNAAFFAWLAGAARGALRRPGPLRLARRAGGALLIGAGLVTLLARRA